jgi:hypothetical protein
MWMTISPAFLASVKRVAPSPVSIRASPLPRNTTFA